MVFVYAPHGSHHWYGVQCGIFLIPPIFQTRQNVAKCLYLCDNMASLWYCHWVQWSSLPFYFPKSYLRLHDCRILLAAAPVPDGMHQRSAPLDKHRRCGRHCSMLDRIPSLTEFSTVRVILIDKTSQCREGMSSGVGRAQTYYPSGICMTKMSKHRPTSAAR